ncbi:reverse transcriptase domain-containing protein [Tanacetum coccineum]
MIVSPEGMEFTYALKFELTATNNEAKYEAVIAGLRIAKEMKIEEITVFVDLQLVANQVNGSYKEKHHHTKQYLQITKELLKGFQHSEVQYIRRNQNKKADVLSKLASLTFEHLTKKVLVEKLANKSIYEKQVAEVATKEEDSWMSPIIEYLVSGILPTYKKLARKIRGMDIIVPLPEALGKVKFLIVAVDYFTKWVEAKPLASVTGKHAERFVWEHIVCHFGIPQMFVSDNGKTFEKGMSNMSEDIQYAGSDTRPPMLDRTDFESWQQRIRLYCLGKDNGENIMKSITEGPFQMGNNENTLTRRGEGALQSRSRTCYEVFADLSI